MEVTVGHENLNFEAGPFTCFGVMALGYTADTSNTPEETQLKDNYNTGPTENERPLKRKVHPAIARIGSFKV